MVCAASLAACLAAGGSWAEAPPLRLSTVPASPAAPSPDPGFEASRQAFAALAESDRKAVQDALIWAGLYNGVVDGNFGKGTREALIAFEKREGLKPDAIVDKGELARLLASAKKAKEAVRFTIIAETATGIKIGLPLKVLVNHALIRGGARFSSSDNAIGLETQAIAQSETDIAGLYARLKAETPDRRVTYKASKPDWFVVSGEAGDKRFYTRFATDGSELRGYTVSYPAAAAPTFGRIAIAMANSFEPFPAGPAATVTTSEPPATAPSAPSPPAASPKLQLTSTGVIVAAGKVLAVIPQSCSNASIGKRSLRLVASEAASGLALFGLADANAAGPILTGREVSAGAPLVIVGYGMRGNAALDVAAGEAMLRPAGGGAPAELRVMAPLQENAAGSPVFDRSGAMVGVIAREAKMPRLVAGIVPEASHPAIRAADLDRFLAANGVTITPAPAASPRTAGDIAASVKDALLPVDCVR